jgi:hypothetical protein
MAVDEPECGVAIAGGLHDDPDADQIVDVLEGAVLLLHLPVDRVVVLGAAGHLSDSILESASRPPRSRSTIFSMNASRSGAEEGELGFDLSLWAPG